MGAPQYISTVWSSDLAYIVGLIASDGNLVRERNSINFTSKDLQLTETFKKCLKLKVAIGQKARGGATEKKYYTVQFGSKNFYGFLLDIGLMSAKSKLLGSLKIPEEYFPDFLRGCIDGDGSIRSFKHSETKKLQLRISIYSASKSFLDWIYISIREFFQIQGGWIEKSTREFVLTYAKRDSMQLLRILYYDKNVPKLERKYMIARQFMGE